VVFHKHALDVHQMGFAAGELIAHVNYMLVEGRLTAEEADGVLRSGRRDPRAQADGPARRIQDHPGGLCQADSGRRAVVDNAPSRGSVKRNAPEDYLGAGPWWMVRWPRDYVTTPDADPVYLYTNDLVALCPNGTSTMANRHCMRTSFTRRRRPSASTSCISEPAPAITPPSWLTSLGHQAGYRNRI